LIAIVPLCSELLVVVGILFIASILVVSIGVLFVRIVEVFVLVIRLMTRRLMAGCLLLKNVLFPSVARDLVLRILMRASPLLVLTQAAIYEILIFLRIIQSLACWSFQLRILLDEPLMYF